jgi:hypothetical protein
MSDSSDPWFPLGGRSDGGYPLVEADLTRYVRVAAYHGRTRSEVAPDWATSTELVETFERRAGVELNDDSER